MDEYDELAAAYILFRLGLMLGHQEGESGRRGRRTPLPQAHFIRTAHRMAESEVQSQRQSDPHNVMFKNTLSNRIYPSRRPFKDLERTTITHLCLEVQASGKYVVIRVLEHGYQVVGWNTVVEDEAGNVCGFSVYNYPPKELFTVGTVLILKEPYFKIANQGFQFLRCDCPTDIIVLRHSHSLFHMSDGIQWKNELFLPEEDALFAKPVPTRPNQWKERGNHLFNKSQLILAREAYLLGLTNCELGNPVFKLLQLNLTAVQFELGYYEAAIKIAEDILRYSPDEKKALFRASMAHYELRQYKEALKCLEKLCSCHPADDEVRTELKRATQRVHEMETGRVDIKRLQQTVAKSPLKKIDCADYVGPVKVVEVCGKGRGVVLTEDVKKDAILMISKALAATLDPSKSVGLQLDPDKTLDTSRNRAEIVAEVAQLVTRNPNTIGPLVYDLSTGGELCERFPAFCDEETKDEPICDVEKIKAICTCNNFGIDYEKGGKFESVGAGLFLFPSYMNHSCVPNVIRSFYNDVMIVQAATELKKGEELCTNYVSVMYSYEERAKLISSRGFTCTCSRCRSQL